MCKTVAAILFSCSLLFAGAAFPGSHHSYGTHSSSRSRKSGGSKSVHVRGYSRKDGTYVAPYDRSAAGSAGLGPIISTSRSGSSVRKPSGTYRKNYIADGVTPDPSIQRDKHGKIKRSSAAKAAFERKSPCPSTGKQSGGCPGYIVDHVDPLECGGADAPMNMQWQTIADAKAKDKTEGSCRQ